MPDTTITLGIDIGSSGTKAVLVDLARGVVASASRPVDLSSLSVGWAEADPAAWWANVGVLVDELLRSAGVDASAVAAVACSGMVPAVLFLDADGRPLRAAILQNDARATREIAELADELTGLDLLGRTGSVLSQQSVAPTVRWVQRHEPDVWGKTSLIVGSYDWLAMTLGAGPHVEENWALESGLFSLEGQALEEIFARVELDADTVPPVVKPGTVIGQVSASGADESGLKAGTPIVVGGADHVLSAYGAGLAHQGDWLVKLGGAGDILAVSDQPRLDARLYLDAHPMPGLWLPNGCMATSGSLVRWLQDLFGNPSLQRLDAEAEAERPAELICLPYFLGEKSPHHDPDLRGAFVGLHLGTTRGGLYRSALEAIAYGFRQHMEILTELGLELGEPRVTNGGSRSSLWKQILADVLECPLVPVVDHPGASLGAAVAAGIGLGALTSWDSVSDLIRTGPPFEPDITRARAYRKGYDMYQAIEPALTPFSHSLAEAGRS